MMFVDYGDRHVVLNNCQSDYRKNLPRANRIIGKIFPTANRIAETKTPRANRLTLVRAEFPPQLFLQAPHYVILHS